MEKTKAFLECNQEDAEAVARLTVPPHRVNIEPSFYEDFALRGIRVDRVELGFISCSFKVPPRLADRDGKLATGAIASLIDEIGAAAVHDEGLPMNVSVDMSISYLATAIVDNLLKDIQWRGRCRKRTRARPRKYKNNSLLQFLMNYKGAIPGNVIDELEITSRALGQRGGYLGTSVLLKNKATGEIIAEGRHSLFSKHASKI